MGYVLSLSNKSLIPEDFQKCRSAFQRFSSKFFSFLHNEPSNIVNVFRDGPVGFFKKAKNHETAADFTRSRKLGTANQISTQQSNSANILMGKLDAF